MDQLDANAPIVPPVNYIVIDGFFDICWQVREGAARRDERNHFIVRPVFFVEKC